MLKTGESDQTACWLRSRIGVITQLQTQDKCTNTNEIQCRLAEYSGLKRGKRGMHSSESRWADVNVWTYSILNPAENSEDSGQILSDCNLIKIVEKVILAVERAKMFLGLSESLHHKN